ncbi:MAG: gliding motility-associated transporter substrate-binding protein GldG [Bacteroidota bacterium]
MWAICKKEWAHYFGSLSGYLIISFYLLVNGVLLFVLPNFNVLDFGYTSLQVYFDFAPWVLVLLIPAITMRSFSEEFNQGTYEILKSLPITTRSILMGKYLGVVTITILAILPTFLYAIALNSLSAVGGIDWGATIGSYLGLFSLAAVYVAVGVFVSSTTKHTIVALLASVLICIFLYKGFDWIAELSFFQNGYDYYIRQLGLSAHYQNLNKGAIVLQDVLYFKTIIFLFGLGCIEQLSGKFKYSWILFVLLLLNYLSYLYPLQIDLTKDQRYTISTQSKTLIQQVNQPVKIHVYLGGELPAHYKKLEIATTQFLEKLQQLNPTWISWEQTVPGEMYKDTALLNFYDSLQKQGLPIDRFQNSATITDKKLDQLLVPGLLIEVEGQKPIAIDLRSSKQYFKPYNVIKDIPEIDVEASYNAAEALLEYKIVQAIYLLNRTVRPSIAFLVGNGEPLDYTVNDLGQSIKNQYNLGVFDLQKGFPDPTKINTLLIVKPSKRFSELDQLKIDQFVLGGGNVIWALDPLYAEYDSLRNTAGEYLAYDRGLGLDAQLFKYGVRVNPNLVQDLNCAKLPMVVGVDAAGAPIIQRVPWPYYPFVQAGSEHPMVQNMDRVLTAFPASIDTVRAIGITKTILLTTDTTSRIISSPTMIQINSGQQEGALASFTQQHIPVAVLLEGSFKSAFSGRLTKALMDSVQMATGKAFKASGDKPAKQIVLADANLMTNFVDPQKGPLPMGVIPYEAIQFANNVFFQNAIAYLNEPVRLLEARKKNLVLRQLDPGKVAANRRWIQLFLLGAPLFLLGIGYWGWHYYRQSRFVESKS